MNLKNWKYLRNAEFKARQLWLDFSDAVGIALRITEEIKERAEKWLTKFKKKCRAEWEKKPTGSTQLDLVFRSKNGRFVKV